MSWCDRSFRALFALCLMTPLAACFRPLYGGESGGATLASLQAIEVDPIPDRMGHYLRDALVFSLGDESSPHEARYRLEVVPKEQINTPVVSTVTGQATAGELAADAHYVLYRISPKSVMTEGDAFASAAYNRSLQEYANVTAAQDAETRAARALADQIRIRLAGYFASHPTKQ